MAVARTGGGSGAIDAGKEVMGALAPAPRAVAPA